MIVITDCLIHVGRCVEECKTLGIWQILDHVLLLMCPRNAMV
jgi:hypothetical protein